MLDERRKCTEIGAAGVEFFDQYLVEGLGWCLTMAWRAVRNGTAILVGCHSCYSRGRCGHETPAQGLALNYSDFAFAAVLVAAGYLHLLLGCEHLLPPR